MWPAALHHTVQRWSNCHKRAPAAPGNGWWWTNVGSVPLLSIFGASYLDSQLFVQRILSFLCNSGSPECFLGWNKKRCDAFLSLFIAQQRERAVQCIFIERAWYVKSLWTGTCFYTNTHQGTQTMCVLLSFRCSRQWKGLLQSHTLTRTPSPTPETQQ